MNQLVYYALLASSAGLCLGINRVLLGRLGQGTGPSAASSINHIGGAIFLFPMMIIYVNAPIDQILPRLLSAPWYAYLGGVIGAIFTMLTSFLIPRLGVMKATVFFISGQMVCSAVFDCLSNRLNSPLRAVLGIFFIIAGVVLGEYQKAKNTHGHAS